MTSLTTIHEFQARQGWTDSTVLSLLVQLLDKSNMQSQLEAYLQECADVENAASEETDD